MNLKPFDKYARNVTRDELFASVEENVSKDIEVMSEAWLEVAEHVLAHYEVTNRFSRLSFFNYAHWRKGKRRYLSKRKDYRYGALKTHFNYAQVSMNPERYLAQGLGACGNGFAMPWTALPRLSDTKTIHFPEEERVVMEQPDLISVKARPKDVSPDVVIMQAEVCVRDYGCTFADGLVWALDWHEVLMKDRVNLLASIEIRLRKMRKKKLLADLAHERKYNKFAGIMESIKERRELKGISRMVTPSLPQDEEDGLPF